MPFINVRAQFVMQEKKLFLNGEWDLFFGPNDFSSPKMPKELEKSSFKKIKATVPGNVEIDLMNAGILPDLSSLSKGTNVFELLKYESYDWWYRKKINLKTLEPGNKYQLVFEGLDCIATVFVNGKIVGSFDNMLIAHKIDITEFVDFKHDNSIAVHIKSPIIEARKKEVDMFNYAFDGNWESLNIRKAPHMFGWNIMPRIVSAGLWRDVYIEQVPETYFRSVYWATRSVDVKKKEASLALIWDLKTEIKNLNGKKLLINVSIDNKTIKEEIIPVVSIHGSHNLLIKEADFWWPRGFGDQPLYIVSVSLIDNDGTLICTNNNKIGIRTVKLDRTNITTIDNPGRFRFLVNGIPVFSKGTNWVPLDAFHSRDNHHLPKMIDLLIDLNCNMVRCWGGNVYEDSGFFDLCDKYGIMVWQDFALACARYPQDELFQKRINFEATEIVKKFRNHPSLVLWAGGNENDFTRVWDGMKQHDPNDDIISRKVLKDVVTNHDPYRDYLPSSPFVSAEVFNAGFDRFAMPEVHLYMKPRGQYKSPFYTKLPASFVSEIGFHGCPDRKSIEEMMDSEYVIPDFSKCNWNDQWLAKSVLSFPKEQEKSATRLQRNDFLVDQIEAFFGRCPDSFDDFIFASQVTQAEANKFSIDFWRSNKPQKMGILWWNLRDGWPIISDAVVDYYYRKKIAYDYIKDAQRNIQAIVCEPENGFHEIVISNDTRNEESGLIIITDVDSGEEYFRSSYSCPANGIVIAGKIPINNIRGMWIIEWTSTYEGKYKSHYLNGEMPFQLSDYRRWFDKAGYVFD